MKHGFIKVAAVSPRMRVADPVFNADETIKALEEARNAGAKVIVFPELSMTGYSCGDLFLQEMLIRGAEQELLRVQDATAGHDELVMVGMPLEVNGNLYNTAAVLQDGEILAFVPKQFVPNYAEFYEKRHFTPGDPGVRMVPFGDTEVPFGCSILFDIDAVHGLSVAAEICEDLWVPDAPDICHALAGATLICNLSASNETVGKDAYARQLVASTSARCMCAYIYVSSGEGESSQDLVFGGRSFIAENGVILAHRRGLDEPEFDVTRITYADVDVHRLLHERRRVDTFTTADDDYLHIDIHMEKLDTPLIRTFDAHPFVPDDDAEKAARCNEILNIQTRALARRLMQIHSKSAVIGISGGLDSTLTLLVTARAFDLLGLDRSGILSVTMPCFGTTGRTYNNACSMAKALGTTLKEVNIKAAVLQHFEDIGHDPEQHDVTFENSQARERTQILMDLANKTNGLVVGTGDMSELALGWATYNGDHMSMYGTNGGVPKTLVSHLVRYCAETEKDSVLQKTLFDVLDTPVSPELLPPKEDGTIAQKTEDLVGPYELHDFFLYYMLRCGFEPSKVFRVAVRTFCGEEGEEGTGTYSRETVLYWLKTFYRRFFNQQFKRSCLPDGPKVGSVALSPRGDLRMPSDASSALWLAELEKLS